MRFRTGFGSRIDEVTPSLIRSDPKIRARQRLCEFSENTQTAEVSFTAPLGSVKTRDGARKDLAVYVSLSSNQIVKEPD